MNQLTRAKVWKRDLAELEERREAFWEFVAIVKRIRDSQTYLEEYATFEEFMEARCGWERRHGYHLITACEVRQSLGTIVHNDHLPCAESQLRELAKVPPAKRAEVFAAVSEKCEEEQREPTAKDYRKAALEYVIDKTEQGERKKPEPRQVDWKALRSIAVQYGERFVRAIDDLHAAKRFDGHENAVRSAQAALQSVQKVVK